MPESLQRWTWCWPALLLGRLVLGPLVLEAETPRARERLPIVDGLEVRLVGHPPAGPTLRVSQPHGRKGPTSIRFFPADAPREARKSPNPADPPGSEYRVRDRDLGQTFRTPPGAPFRLTALTLRVGPAPAGGLAGIEGARGAPVFLQVMEVSGAPVVHDNGTIGTTTVSRAYPGRAIADDYVTGESYATVLVARGGRLPESFEVGESNTAAPTPDSAGSLLRFDLASTGGVVLQPERTYAFMIGFESGAPWRALPLDNYDYVNQPGAEDALVAAGPYADGHAIRREGRVEAPHAHLGQALSPDESFSRFPSSFAERLLQQPGTWGRPDVDTWRDLVFWIEGEDAEAAGGSVALSVVDAPPSGPQVVARHEGHDRGGNTSVAHDRADSYKWSGESPYPHGGWGYFTRAGVEVAYVKRDRDLGQTFRYRGERPARLDAVTVRTGFGTNAVRRAAYGGPVSLQLFRVTGTPVVNDNGTSGSTAALHGFPHDRAGRGIPAERDDYLEGETYVHLMHATGGRFPAKTAFGLRHDADVDPADERLKGRYLRFDLRGGPEIVLEPGSTYAFLVMIDEAGDDRGFTLANLYRGAYADGHAIRRDGDGTFPPTPADTSRPFADPANAGALAAARFPRDVAQRLKIAPGTNGYPDVDTWRDLEFWIERTALEPDRTLVPSR